MQEVRETVYEHLSSGETFTVTAAERWSVAMLRRLKEKYPEQVKIVSENKDGSLLARVPFDWMRIVPKRRDTMTDEQRATQSERMKAQKLKWDTEKSDQIRTVAAETGKDISQPLDGEKEA